MLKPVHLLFGVPLIFLMLQGCTPLVGPRVFDLTAESLALRELQTRDFDMVDEETLMAAGVAVLQDLGFTVASTESRLGLIIASKTQRAHDPMESLLAAIFTGVAIPGSYRQEVRASLVAMPLQTGKNRMKVRITFQRIVSNAGGQPIGHETIKNTEIYRSFFERLTKAVFLETHES